MNRANLSVIQQTAADRWLMELAAMSGAILVGAECLHSVDNIHRVLRALTWGGAFCGIVAALQFWLGLDITHYLRDIPGFSLNQAAAANDVIGSRGGHNRVPGTAIDPIEMGVVAGMLLPLAVYMAMHDKGRSWERRWLPVICIAICIPTSVSRSAVISVLIALGVLIVSLPPARRLMGLAGLGLSVVAVFLTSHGLLGTFKDFFLAGTADPSIAHRVNAYSYVDQLVANAPWFGQGGGTYSGQQLYSGGQAIHILDDQYLGTAIELGLVGLTVLVFFFLWPACSMLVARSRTTDPRLRDLCAALAGSTLAAGVCSATFDSFGFPMFVNVTALVIGLTGAVWLQVQKERGEGLGNSPWRRRNNQIPADHLDAGRGAAEPAGGK
jgi:O-antigen ligase